MLVRIKKKNRAVSRISIPRNPGIKEMTRVIETANLNFLTDVSGLIALSISTHRPNTSIGLVDWANFAAVFDSYKVYSIEFLYSPRYPYDTSVTTAYSPVAVYLDVDTDTGVPPATAWSGVLAYQTHRQFQMYKPYRTKYQLPSPTAVSGTSSNPVYNGWLDIATESTNAVGSINFISLSTFPVAASTTYGWLSVRWVVGFANKR